MATGGFSPDNIIGDGSFGFVYGDTGAGNGEFRAELEVINSLSHTNLARLLRYMRRRPSPHPRV